MRRRIDDTATAMGGRVITGDGSRSWQGATLDSRSVEGGELFFALPGETTDGHRFAADALAAGAAAAVVHRDVEAPPDGALIRVDDTLEALHALVSSLRREGAPPRLVALTGSVGKTTTKDLLAAMMERRWRVAKNEGNLNNLYGFPLSLLRIPDDAEWMVAEMGMSTPGELARLSELSRPDAAVFIAVRPVHLEFFDDLRGIAEAKAELLEGMPGDALVVANADDPEVVRFVERWAAGPGADGRLVWFGRGPRADVAAEAVEPAGDAVGSRFRLLVRQGVTPEGEALDLPVHLALHGGYNVDNALAAAACALALGVPPQAVAAALAAARPAAGRGIVRRLAGSVTVVDDTYNSNPDALERALAAAAELPAERRWAVLGDMLELGPDAPRFHREAGERAAAAGFEPVVGVGELAEELCESAAAAGVEAPWFEDAAAAADWAADELADGDLVLVKGSRGVGLDAVVERLLAEAGDDGGEG